MGSTDLKEVLVSRTTASRNSRSASVVLAPLDDPEQAPPVARIHGRPLRPELFKPETGRPDEADGKPLTKFGGRFREVFAKAQGIDADQVDIGLLRQVEALNADTDRNLASLSTVRAKRTEHGTLQYVPMIVNTPLLEPWLLNGRALRRMGAELRDATQVVTTAVDHPTLALPTMHLDGPEAVLEIIAAQRRLLGLESYTSSGGKKEKRDRVDSIIQFGVLEPPDVVLVQLQSDRGSAWVGQAAEGAQRLFSALVGLDQLASRSVAMVGTEHWLTGEPALRDLTPTDLEGLGSQLTFPASAAAGYFPGRAVAVKDWLETTAATVPAAVAFQLLRTVEVNLIIAVEPDPSVEAGQSNPVSNTIQEMIRSYHVPGKAKDQWDPADVQGLIGIGAIDELLAKDRISPEQRVQWLGSTLPAWQAGSDGTPSRLLSVAQLVAFLTAQHAAPSTTNAEDSLAVVNRHLKVNGQRPHPEERARVAAAQAVVALGVGNSGRENTISAAIAGAFRSPWFWKTDDHPAGRWTALLATPVQELADKALAESKSSDSADTCGPAQRALAALGGLALMTNAGLLEEDNALTRTARGGGGKRVTLSGDTVNVKASDPNVLLAAMVRDERGINQLHDAVVAVTMNAEHTIPIDRENKHELDEFWLRELWLGETSKKKEDNPLAEFARLIKELAEAMADGAVSAEFLRTALPGDVIGLERDDDDQEMWDEPVYERIGVSAQTADSALTALRELVDFFTTGKAYARAASRAAR